MRPNLLLFILVLVSGAIHADQSASKPAPTIAGARLDSPMEEFVWCGEHNEVVLIRTENNTVYRSEDKGASFSQVDPGELGEVANIVKSEADDQLLLFVSVKGLLSATQDCGATLKALNTKEFAVAQVRLHPVEKAWMLAAAVQDCSNVKDCVRTAFALYMTQDLGEHWRKIATNVQHFEWPFNEQQISAGVPANRIFASIAAPTHNYVVRTDDFFSNSTVMATNTQEFMLRATYLFVSQRSLAGDVILLVATISDQFNNLVATSFPQETALRAQHFRILDTSEAAVFVLVTRSASSPFGSLYVSDSTGVRYTLSLKRCLSAPTHGADFARVMGLEGIYVANVLDSRAAKEFARQAEADEGGEEEWEDEEREETSLRKGSEEGKRKKLTINLVKNNVRTLITFNKGGSWRYLQPPKFDAQGKAIHCQGDEECALHLYIHRGTTVPLYSHRNAHGLILATGNVGAALLYKPFTRNVYFSRDAGLTWAEIAKGPHVYDMADHGGILVLAELEASGKKSLLRYSWNEGTSWQTVKIAGKNGSVEDIFTEPDSGSQRFFARVDTYDSDQDQSTMHRYTSVYSVNFESLHGRQCKGEDKPGAPDSDYVIWSPYDGRHGDKCLLGRKMAYARRRPDSECYNGARFEHPVSVENCLCTEEDYECDFGFQRADMLSNSPCTAAQNLSYAPPEHCPLVGYYAVTSGYRKVSGDSCQGGVRHDLIMIPCPHFLVSRSGLIILVLLVIAAAAVVVVWYNYGGKGDPKGRTSVQGKTAKSKDSFGEVRYGRVEADEELNIVTARPGEGAAERDSFSY